MLPEPIEINNHQQIFVINEIEARDYNAHIVVATNIDGEFLYALVDDGKENDPDTVFTNAKARLVIDFQYRGANDVDKKPKKFLILKANKILPATLEIRETLVELEPLDESMPSANTGRVLLPKRQQYMDENSVSIPKEWYKDPWILGGILVALLLFAYFSSSSKNRNRFKSIFVD